MSSAIKRILPGTRNLSDQPLSVITRSQTSFTYQLQDNGSYAVSGVQRKGYNALTGHGKYYYFYNSNNQVKAVVDAGNRSTLVWDSFGNRIAVVDPYGKRTTTIYDSMGRVSAVRNASDSARRTYDSQGRTLGRIRSAEPSWLVVERSDCA